MNNLPLLTKRQAIKACRVLADELIYRMEREVRFPLAKSTVISANVLRKRYAMDHGTRHQLAAEAFGYSIQAARMADG